MSPSRLRTVRLELAPTTIAIAEAELSGREALSRALGADVPLAWPPEYFDREAAEFSLDALRRDPESVGWWSWYVLRRELVAFPIAIGICGYKGPPGEDGTVEIGFSILLDHRRRGYATEATAVLIGRAWAFPGVSRIVAEVLPGSVPSIGTLEKLGFRLDSTFPAGETLRYELRRG